MLNNILQPEVNKKLLRSYHTSGKLLIPLLVPSLIFKKYEVNPILEKSIDTVNILNFGYHSYVSTSCIVTDYVKPRLLSHIVRSSSFGLHGLAVSGFIYSILKEKI